MKNKLYGNCSYCTNKYRYGRMQNTRLAKKRWIVPRLIISTMLEKMADSMRVEHYSQDCSSCLAVVVNTYGSNTVRSQPWRNAICLDWRLACNNFPHHWQKSLRRWSSDSRDRHSRRCPHTHRDRARATTKPRRKRFDQNQSHTELPLSGMFRPHPHHIRSITRNLPNWHRTLPVWHSIDTLGKCNRGTLLRQCTGHDYLLL